MNLYMPTFCSQKLSQGNSKIQGRKYDPTLYIIDFDEQIHLK